MISVIVPSYNQGQYLAATLDSILSQTGPPFECLVIDGNSTDETPSVLSRYAGSPQLTIISEPDDGVVDAVNKGLRMAQGDLLAVQSSDDLYTPGAFDLAHRLFLSNPATGLIFGNCRNILADGSPAPSFPIAHFSLERLCSGQVWIPQCSAFLSAAAVRTVGPWDPSLPYVPDLDHYLRLAFRYPVVQTQHVLGLRREHQAQRDREGARIRRDHALMVQKLCGDPSVPARLRCRLRARDHLLALRYPALPNWTYQVGQLLRALRICPSAVSPSTLTEILILQPLRAIRRRLTRR